ncbi:Type I transmembrane sorting receptor [Orbilia brochopaga]|uniref:Type I transmembrane sorting receptor n=1 Tax=Orbilia brochopaga TaxID=3140254 RepID=A0AAV9TZU6_9PEZI
MVATKTFLIAASALGAMAAPAIPMHVSPGIELPNGPGRFGQKKEGNNFNVRALPNPHFKPNGKRALQKIYAKYNLETPSYLREIVRRGDGSVAATPGQYDIEYVCPVEIGGQTLNLDFDTGSSDLWVFSSLMPKSSQGSHDIYDPKKSETGKEMTGATWKISYGDGSSASGVVYTDTVKIGGVVVEGQAVELAKKVSSSFTSDPSNDGLVGLAFGSINTVKPRKQKTFFENAMSGLSDGVMTADLKHGQPGSYDFGTIDSSKYTGDIKYIDIDASGGFWEFDADGSTAIADTGTTLLLVSNKITKAYYSKIKGAKMDNSQGGYVFPCSTNPPDLDIPVGDDTVTISGGLLNYAPLEEGSDTCFGGVQGYDGGMHIYGDVFFKQFFSVFDYKQKRFGYASKPSNSSSHHGHGN